MSPLTSEHVRRGATIDIAGVPTAVEAGDDPRADAVASMFRHAREHDGPPAASLSFTAAPVAIPRRAPDAVKDGLAVWRDADVLILRIDAGLTARASAHAIEVGGDAQVLPSAFRYAAFLALTHVLGTRGLHLLHGGAVAVDGHAVLVVGGTGKGKSTAVLAATTAGWTALADDMVVVHRGDGGVAVNGVARPISVEAELVGGSSDVRPVPGDHRGRVELPEGTLDLARYRVAGVVVPTHGSEPEAGLSELPSLDALRALVSSSTSLVGGVLQRDVFAVAAAAARCPAWTLAHGTDPAQRVASAAARFGEIRDAL